MPEATTPTISDESVEKAWKIFWLNPGGGREAMRAALTAVLPDLAMAENKACAEVVRHSQAVALARHEFDVAAQLMVTHAAIRARHATKED